MATWLGGRVEIVRADITTLQVDAIVNAANASLEETRTLGGTPPGTARITSGYDLPARHVIHAVGPVWRGGSTDEDQTLESAYRRSLELAAEHAVESIAFPSISTGIYGFPLERATRIAHGTARDWLATNDLPRRVVFCVFSQGDLDVHEAIADEVFGSAA